MPCRRYLFALDPLSGILDSKWISVSIFPSGIRLCFLPPFYTCYVVPIERTALTLYHHPTTAQSSFPYPPSPSTVPLPASMSVSIHDPTTPTNVDEGAHRSTTYVSVPSLVQDTTNGRTFFSPFLFLSYTVYLLSIYLSGLSCLSFFLPCSHNSDTSVNYSFSLCRRRLLVFKS